MEFTLAQSAHQEPQFSKLPVARRSVQCLILGQEPVSVELTSQNRSSEGKLGTQSSSPKAMKPGPFLQVDIGWPALKARPLRRVGSTIHIRDAEDEPDASPLRLPSALCISFQTSTDTWHAIGARSRAKTPQNRAYSANGADRYTLVQARHGRAL